MHPCQKAVSIHLSVSTELRYVTDRQRDRETQTDRHRPMSSTALAYRRAVTQEAQLSPIEGPRDASCQLKYCQLPCNSAETTYTTSPDRIDGMKLEI